MLQNKSKEREYTYVLCKFYLHVGWWYKAYKSQSHMSDRNTSPAVNVGVNECIYNRKNEYLYKVHVHVVAFSGSYHQ